MTAPKRTNRNSDTTTIGSAFKSLLHEYHLEDKYKEKQLMASWSRIMGHPIAIRTNKLYFKDKKLSVHLSSAPLKSELDHSKNKVMEILNREIGEGVVEDIIFL